MVVDINFRRFIIGVYIMLQHGGGLIKASKKYNIALENWLDLSTGINPQGWIVPEIPQAVYNRLPEEDDELQASAKKYYQTENLLAVPGSQSVIQLLPQILNQIKPIKSVAVPHMAYAEHAHAWQQAGSRVNALTTQQINLQLQDYDVLVVINPNNPTGEKFSVTQLLSWLQTLQKKSAWLIIDEAFIDSDNECSLAKYAGEQGLIILRSVGKFFGLAGIRSGFVLAEETLLQKIKIKLGPWALSGPSRFISACALQDESWQKQNRKYLKQHALKLKNIIKAFALKNNFEFSLNGTELFQTLFINDALGLHESLARNAIYTRLLDNQSGIRFGLPKDSEYLKLESALAEYGLNMADESLTNASELKLK